MTDAISSIGVRLTLDAKGYMSEMEAATSKTNAFVAATEKATTAAGAAKRGGGGRGAAGATPAQTVAVGVDLTVSKTQLSSLRRQIQAELQNIPITVNARVARSEAQAVVAAVSTPVVGTRSGAAHAVESSVRQNLPKRAMGGPVYPGTTYLVGERGPEMFRPAMAGAIHRMHGGYATGGNITAKYANELREWQRNLREHARSISPSLAKSARDWYEIARAQAMGDLADFGRLGMGTTGIGAFAAASPGQAWPSNRAILRQILEHGSATGTVRRDVPGFGMTQATAPYGYGNWKKAADILRTGSLAGLSGPKVTPFFGNLSGLDPDAWTLDARQMRIASANKLTSAPAGGSWQRKILEQAHEDLYPELQRMWGVKVRSQAQAILWAGYGRGEDLGTDFRRTSSGIIIPRHPGILVPTRRAGGLVDMEPARQAFRTAKEARDYGAMERARRDLEPLALATLNSENARRKARGALPLTLADVNFDADNVLFHAAEPESMARYRYGKPKGGSINKLQVDMRPWESILDEEGSWRWLGENDPAKPITYQTKRAAAARKQAAKAKDKDVAAWWERQAAEADYIVQQYEVLQARIERGDLGWRGAAGPPSQKDVLPALQQAERTLSEYLASKDPKGMAIHIKEARRELDVMSALWAQAGGAPRGAVGASRTGPGSLMQLLRRNTEAARAMAEAQPHAAEMTAYGLRPGAAPAVRYGPGGPPVHFPGVSGGRTKKPGDPGYEEYLDSHYEMLCRSLDQAAQRGQYELKKRGKLWELVVDGASSGTVKTEAEGRKWIADQEAVLVRMKQEKEEIGAYLATQGKGPAVAATPPEPPKPPLPPSKSPEQIEHERITAEGLARRQERVAALEAQKAAAAPVEHDLTSPYGLFMQRAEIARGRAASDLELLERAKKSGLYLRRARGGYIVNEEGPEAFLTLPDARRLGRLRPDIMADIPDGAKTGMIRKPAWSLFRPQKDGFIVPAHYAQEALHALRRQDGGDATIIGGSTGPVLPGPFVPTGPLFGPMHGPPSPIQLTAGARFEAEHAATEALAAFTSALGKATGATQAQIAAGNDYVRQLEAGPIQRGPGTTPPTNVLPPGGMEMAPGGPFPAPLIYQGGVGEPAVPGRYYYKARQAVQAAERAQATPATPAATMAAAAPAGMRAVNELKRLPPGTSISTEEYAALVAGGLEEAAGLGPQEQAALRFGQVKATQMRARRGGRTADDILAETRAATAGIGQLMPGRTPRGAFAVVSEFILGGGQEFKRRQAQYQLALSRAQRAAALVDTWEERTEAKRYAVEEAERTGADTTKLLEQQNDHEITLAATRENLTARTKELDVAEKKVIPTAGSVVRSLGSIVAATAAYGLAFAVIGKAIQAAEPAVKRFVDEMLGFSPVATRVTNQMGEAIAATHGNVDAVMAQTAVTTGMSKAMLDFVAAGTTGSAVAKAAAQSQLGINDAYRASISMQRGGAPEGLFGGFGGVLGSSFLGETLGGGKGFTELISEGLLKAGGVRGPELPQGLNVLTSFFANPTYRRFTQRQAQGTGAQGLFDVLGGFSENFPAIAAGATSQVPFIGGTLAPLVAGMLTPPPTALTAGEHPTSRLAAPILAGRTAVEREGIQTYLADLTEAARKGADAQGEQTIATYQLTSNTKEIDQAMRVAFAAGDEWGAQMAEQGVVLRKANGEIVATTDEYTRAASQIARGRNILDPTVWARQNLRQLQAQEQVLAMETQRQVQLEIPFGMTRQLLAQPIIQPGLGFFPGAGRGQPSPGAAGLTGNAARFAGQALSGTARLNTELQALADQGLAAARAEIAKWNPEDLPAFNEAYGMAQDASQSIALLTSRMAQLNRAASQASWSNQIRLANRALGDALGVLGRVGSTRMGQLQREEQMINRAATQLSLALQQRQITTQIALAGFQAPGETGEERYMRQKERLAEADIAQQQLDLSKQAFSTSVQIWTENARRAAIDAARAINVMQAARNAEGYAIAAQERIAKEQMKLGAAVGRMDSYLNRAGGNFRNALSAAAQGIGEFAGSVAQAVDIIYTALGYDPRQRRNDRNKSTGHMGNYSHGYLGAFARGATFTVGEAGPETVAILRNPRTHMIQGEGGSGWSGNLNININGPVVRDDGDIGKLARAVAAEVERNLSKKGQMLGLRQPAY